VGRISVVLREKVLRHGLPAPLYVEVAREMKLPTMPLRCAAAEERARAGPLMPRRCAAAEGRVRAGPSREKNVLVSRGGVGCIWVRSFKVLSQSFIQGFGQGIRILC
jgi:hypothetical protein